MAKLAGPTAKTTLTGREFNQRTGRARRAANDGPVIVTDRGKPAYVLMTYDEFRRLSDRPTSLAEALAGPPELDFDFDPPRLRDIVKPFEFD